MANFIFNANKRKLKDPQTTRHNSILKDVYGNPLHSIQVLFDTAQMKQEAIKRLMHLASYYAAAPEAFPEKLQSGLDPKAKTTKSLMIQLLERIDTWKGGAEIFEAFIIRHNDLLDYIKAHQSDTVFQQELETDYAIRITPRKRVKPPVRTNLNDLIDKS